MTYIDVKDLAFQYDDEPVLENISFKVEPGDFLILTGENGAAKTTLLRNILGLLQPLAMFPNKSLPSMSVSQVQSWNWLSRDVTHMVAGLAA